MSLSRRIHNFRTNFEDSEDTDNLLKAKKLVNTVQQCLDKLVDLPLKSSENDDSEQRGFRQELILDEDTLNFRLEHLNSVVNEKRQELGLSGDELERAFHDAKFDSQRRRHFNSSEMFSEVLDQVNLFLSCNLTFNDKPSDLHDDDKFSEIKNLLVNSLMPMILTNISINFAGLPISVSFFFVLKE